MKYRVKDEISAEMLTLDTLENSLESFYVFGLTDNNDIVVFPFCGHYLIVAVTFSSNSNNNMTSNVYTDASLEKVLMEKEIKTENLYVSDDSKEFNEALYLYLQ